MKTRRIYICFIGLMITSWVAQAAPTVVSSGETHVLDYLTQPPDEPVVVQGGCLYVENLPADTDPFSRIFLHNGRIVFTHGCSSEGFQLPLFITSGDTIELPAGYYQSDTLVVMDGGVLRMDASILNMHCAGIIAEDPDELCLKNLTLSNSVDAPLICIDGGGATLSHLQFLTAGTALSVLPSAQVLIDSCQFQGNQIAVRVRGNGNLVHFSQCDFVESTGAHLLNETPECPVQVDSCYHDDSQAFTDGIVESHPSVCAYFEKEVPEALSDSGVPDFPEGNELLICWPPVLESVRHKPITVSYRVYRHTEPYFDPAPEYYVGTVREPAYTDTDLNGEPGMFYRITAVIGE